MKRLLYIILFLPFLIGCNQKKVDRLESVNDSLVQQAYIKDSSLSEFLQAMNDIQYNLDSIKSREMIIHETKEGKMELKQSSKDRIVEDINTIYNLLDENKEKLSELRKKLGKANYHVKELEKMLSAMTVQIERKDKEIAQLTETLLDMDVKINALTKDVNRLTEETTSQSKTIEEQAIELEAQTIEMNTGFYLIGTKKELKDANVLTSEGGFIGIGKNKKLKPDFSEENFTRIDIRETSSFEIPGKKADIVTSHPPESFRIRGEGENRILVVTDYVAFWKTSKYLVIVIQ